MSDLERRSLEYFMGRACEGQWQSFLRAMAEELSQQMPAAELRAFLFLVGKRMADAHPLPPGQTLTELEAHCNAYFGRIAWGWLRVRDLESSLEFLHSCAPLRQAFGDGAIGWASGVLEGLYAGWLAQMGAGDQLVLQQIGPAEGICDTLRFRLAHPQQI